jgi:3(or 17)beta-hydroxysteroid dehydrogenase
MGRVSGKIAIVTGGASGLGAATARMLAREAAKVVLADRQVDLGEAVAKGIRDAGGEAVFFDHDVTSEVGWQAIIDKTEAVFGGLQIVVNAAGIALPSGNAEEHTLSDWRKVMSVNLDGVFLGTKYGIGAIRRSGVGGSIVNFSSTLGIAGDPRCAAYTASKGGVRVFSKSAALHCAQSGYGIRVNSIHPGYIRTPMLEEGLKKFGDLEEMVKAILPTTPLGHVGEPDDIAYGVLYLASDESKFVTGAELVIDGGYLAQ